MARELEAAIEEALEPVLRRTSAHIRDTIRNFEDENDGLKDELALAHREIERLAQRNHILEAQLRGEMPKKRGRPAKSATAQAVPIPLKKKRGRPPKLSVAPQGTLKGQPKRGPGRPKKVPPPDMVQPAPAAAATQNGTAQPVKRPRGRPRKVVSAAPPPETVHARGRSAEAQEEIEQREAQAPAEEQRTE